MGTLTMLSETQAQYHQQRTSDPPAGTYTFRGVTKEGTKIWQCDGNANVICIQIFNDLISVGDVQLKNLQHSSGAGSGGANYGLTQSPNTVFSYNTVSQQVTIIKYKGQNGSDVDAATVGPVISDSSAFNMPNYISDREGNRFYPLNYWFYSGNANYFSPTPPIDPVFDKLRSADRIYRKVQFVEKLTLTDVRTYDQQKRDPDQGVVMGRALGSNVAVGARDHLLAVFGISSEPRSWHWCHLIAHSLRANQLGQVPENLVAGTAAVNGAMLALEKAVKQLLIDNAAALSHLDYEVEAHVLEGSHVAKFIKATVGQFGRWACEYRMEATVAERELTSQTAEFLREFRLAAQQQARLTLK
ncbi:MAG TPA: hypothetical protein VMU81_03640 [Acetobacteraceae bacterium]|nr:hypothetical protein [Acetobacteraceae bacterium]